MLDAIRCFGLSNNQVAHAVCMYADDELKDNLYSLHELLVNDKVRDNIMAVDENVECDEDYLNDMVKFVESLDKGKDWSVYVVVDDWSPRETIRIEGIIAFS